MKLRWYVLGYGQLIALVYGSLLMERAGWVS